MRGTIGILVLGFSLPLPRTWATRGQAWGSFPSLPFSLHGLFQSQTAFPGLLKHPSLGRKWGACEASELLRVTRSRGRWEQRGHEEGPTRQLPLPASPSLLEASVDLTLIFLVSLPAPAPSAHSGTAAIFLNSGLTASLKLGLHLTSTSLDLHK